jgi:hypothetical protein
VHGRMRSDRADAGTERKRAVIGSGEAAAVRLVHVSDLRIGAPVAESPAFTH